MNSNSSRKIRIGLYGNNGHQLHALLSGKHPYAEITACSNYKPPDTITLEPSIRHFNSLAEMAHTADVDLISLCTADRSKQAADTILCLKAGKHVYAEKPCALNEEDLERILVAARHHGVQFREMAGTTLANPYAQIREIIDAGKLGTVVQVFAQKSYPYHDNRPQDEAIDGGLVLQVGIHAVRMVEHVTGLHFTELMALETSLGNPKEGALKMAASLQGRLSNGGVASIVLNYLNSPQFGRWGNDQLRVMGTLGFVESVDDGQRTTLALNNQSPQSLPVADEPMDHITHFLLSLLSSHPMPLTLEEELHPLRVLLRIKDFPSKT